MGTKTNIWTVGIAGSLVAVVLGLLGAYDVLPDLPDGWEGEATVLVAIALAFILPDSFKSKVGPSVLVIALGLGSVSCATVRDYNPVEAAETPEQKAYAVYGLYVASVGLIVDLAENERIPLEVVEGLNAAARVLEPSVDALLESALLVDRVRKLVQGGPEAGQDALDQAIRELVTGYEQIRPEVEKLFAAARSKS